MSRLLVCVLIGMSSQISLAQTLAIGQNLYQKGDFNGAIAALQKALDGKNNAQDQAKIHKFIGICHFMVGKRGAAATSFKQAISLDADTNILASEVLDEEVLKFFATQKSTAIQSNQVRKPSSAQASVAQPANQSIAGPKVIKTTFLKVTSTTPDASVSIDGIIAGSVNSVINTDPGQINIEVSAPGYNPKSVTTNIIANRENNISVNLDRVKPVTKAKPPTPRPQASGETTVARRRANTTKRKTNDDDLFATPGADSMFSDPSPAASPANEGTAPTVDATAEFQRDTQNPTAAYPAGQAAAPSYPQQAYPPPNYAPPVYQQPAPYYPPPPTYYTPPPPQPLPVAPDYPLNDPGSAGDFNPSGSPNQASLPRRRVPKVYKSMLLVMAPMGVGQFQNRDYVSGILVAAGQVAGLYMWYDNQARASQVAKVANDFAQNTPQEKRTPEQEKWLESRKKEVKTYNDTGSMWLNIAAGVWAIGIADAYLNDPPPPKKSPRRRRRSPPLILQRADEAQEEYVAHESVRQEPLLPRAHWQIKLGLSPSPTQSLRDATGVIWRPGLALHFAWQH